MQRGDKICIVGGGASGLAASHWLGASGYTDVVVYEASDRVGGKCRTVEIDGHNQELGAVIAGPGYTNVLTLAEQYGVPCVAAPDLRVASVDTGQETSGSLPKFTDLPMWSATVKLWRLMYANRHLYRPGLGTITGDLDLPCSAYLDRHGLQLARNVLMPMFTGYGYGHEQDIPVVYLFKMMCLAYPRSRGDFSQWMRSLRTARPAGWFSHLMEAVMLRDGFEGLWRAVASEQQVRLGSPVSRITRTDKTVTVTVNGEHHQFDHLIVATPPAQTLQYLDADDDERTLLKQVRTHDYHSFVVELDGPLNHRALYLRENVLERRRGRPVVLAHTQPETRLAQAYVYGDGEQSLGDMERNIAQDAAAFGLTMRGVVAHQQWDYFPHLVPDQVQAFGQAIQARQGQRRTYWAGEMMEFSTVESCAAYARHLVGHYFGDSQ